MAPLPKRKLSRQRGRERFAGQQSMVNMTKNLLACSNCKKIIVAHMVCKYCGYYREKKLADAVK